MISPARGSNIRRYIKRNPDDVFASDECAIRRQNMSDKLVV